MPGPKAARPWWVEFFFDQTKPLPLRGGIAAVIFLVCFYPILSLQFRSSPPPEASDVEKQPTTEPLPQEPAGENGTSAEETPSPANEAPKTPVASGAIKVIRTNTGKLSNLFQRINQVNSLFSGAVVTHDGDLWISSSEQIYQFQGSKIDPDHFAVRLDGATQDQIDDTPPIESIMEAPDGAIWAGAKDGTLFRYSRYDWKVMAAAREPFDSSITALAGFENKLFVGGSGLWKWDNATSKITKYPAFKGTAITGFSIRTRSEGTKELLMLSESGIWRLNEKGWEQFLPLSGSDRRANCLLDLGNEGLLVGTADGLLRFSPAGIVLERMLAGNEVTAIRRDREGRLWVGTRNAGLKFSNGTDWYQAAVDEGFPGSNVSFLEFDATGDLILGIFGKGLYKSNVETLAEALLSYPDRSKIIDTQKPKIFSTACKAAADEIRQNSSGQVSLYRLDGKDYAFFSGRQVCPLGAGFLSSERKSYFLSGWNLTIVSDNSRQEVEIPKELPADQVKKVLFVDSKRNVWFGPTTTGPFVYHPSEQANEKGKFEHFESVAELVNNPTSFIIEDKNGVIWVGSAPPFDRNGKRFLAPSLHSYDGNVWKHFTPKDGITSWMLQDAALRKDGSIAVAGDNGLFFIRGNTFEKVRASDALRKRFMYSVFEDKMGDLWIGHQLFGIGLTYFNSSEFHTITTEKGFFSDRIIAVSQDEMERIWVLSSNGSVGIYPRPYFDRKLAEPDAPEASSNPDEDGDGPPKMKPKEEEEYFDEDKPKSSDAALVGPSDNMSSRSVQVEDFGEDEE